MRNNLRIHPGRFLKEDILEFNNLAVTDGARLLGIPDADLSDILEEKTAISPDLAIRISKVFGGTPDIWLRLQMKYDLSDALEHFDAQGADLQEFHYA